MSTPANPTVDKFGRTLLPVVFTPAGPSHDISFLIKNASTPSALYIERDDSLLMVAATSQVNEVVTYNLRVLTPDGRINDMQFQQRPTNSRAPVTLVQVLAEGYLLSMSVNAAIATSRGQTFARAMITRSGTGVSGAAQSLFADYVTTFSTPGYPNGRIVSPTEGQGLVYGVTVGNPAAGVDWSVNVPLNTRWRVRSWVARLTCSAAAANRQPQAQVIQGGNSVWLGQPIANIVASAIVNIAAGGLTPIVSVNANGYMLPLPPDLLLTGNATFAQSLGTATTGIQAGDQWSAIQLLVEEWLDNV
jgi:hypothetical protein